MTPELILRINLLKAAAAGVEAAVGKQVDALVASTQCDDNVAVLYHLTNAMAYMATILKRAMPDPSINDVVNATSAIAALFLIDEANDKTLANLFHDHTKSSQP